MATKTEVFAVIQKQASALREQGTARLTEAAAIAKVCVDNPSLYESYRMAMPDPEPQPVTSVQKAEFHSLRKRAEELAKQQNISLIDALVQLGGQRLAKAEEQPDERMAAIEKDVLARVAVTLAKVLKDERERRGAVRKFDRAMTFNEVLAASAA